MYNGYGIIYDIGGSWSFDNGIARNVIIFGVDSTSASHVDNRKNNFLVIGLGPAHGINGKLDSAEKKFSINITKSSTKFCFSLQHNDDNSYLFVNKKE